MHNKRIGRDDMLKIEVCFYLPPARNLSVGLTNQVQWARTPPSASWRFDSGRDRPRGERGDRGDRSDRGVRSDRSPRRRSTSPRRDRGGAFSPRKDDRRERDYERRDRDRSRSPDGDREMKDVRDRDEERGDRGDRERDDRRERDAPAAEERKSETSAPHDDDLL